MRKGFTDGTTATCCGHLSQWHRPVIYIGFEQSYFQPIDGQGFWWVESFLPSAALKLADETSEDRKDYQAVYATVDGWLSPNGIYGHMACCQHEIFIENVLELRRSTEAERAKSKIK